MDDTLTVIEDRDAAHAALMPLRRRILSELTEPASAAEVATRLDMPRQKVNYHMRVLEDHGLIELAEERPRRGFIERRYRRSTAIALAPDLVDRPIEPGEARDRWAKQAVVSAATDVIRAIGSSTGSAPTAAMVTDVTFATPKAMRDFLDEVASIASRYSRDDVDGGIAFRISLLGHHVPTRPAEGAGT